MPYLYHVISSATSLQQLGSVVKWLFFGLFKKYYPTSGAVVNRFIEKK